MDEIFEELLLQCMVVEQVNECNGRGGVQWKRGEGGNENLGNKSCISSEKSYILFKALALPPLKFRSYEIILLAI